MPVGILSRIAAERPDDHAVLRYVDHTSTAGANALNTVTLTEDQKLRDAQGREVTPTVVIVTHKLTNAGAPVAVSWVAGSTTSSQIGYTCAAAAGVPVRIYYG
jgi:hypothetical protein